MYNFIMNNVNISKRKLINDEKEPFSRDCVLNDVTFKRIIILLKSINHSNSNSVLFLRKWF